MAKCEICNKSVIFGKSISRTRSHLSKRFNSTQKPNIRKIKIVKDGVVKHINVCTRCMRSNKVVRAQ